MHWQFITKETGSNTLKTNAMQNHKNTNKYDNLCLLGGNIYIHINLSCFLSTSSFHSKKVNTF